MSTVCLKLLALGHAVAALQIHPRGNDDLNPVSGFVRIKEKTFEELEKEAEKQAGIPKDDKEINKNYFKNSKLDLWNRVRKELPSVSYGEFLRWMRKDAGEETNEDKLIEKLKKDLNPWQEGDPLVLTTGVWGGDKDSRRYEAGEEGTFVNEIQRSGDEKQFRVQMSKTGSVVVVNPNSVKRVPTESGDA